jgi:hypothetical protein
MRAALSAIGRESVAPAWKELSPPSWALPPVLDDFRKSAAARSAFASLLEPSEAVGKGFVRVGPPLGIQMAAGPVIRRRAGTSAEPSRLTSSRLSTGVETGSQEVAGGFSDSHVETQRRLAGAPFVDEQPVTLRICSSSISVLADIQAINPTRAGPKHP